MKIKSVTIAAMFTITMAAPATMILHAPTDHDIINQAVVSVDTITSSELNGTDNLFITYTVNNTLTANADSWATLTVNTAADDIYDFLDGGVGAFLTRVYVGNNSQHELFASGAVADADTAASFTASDGLAHAVRITISGFSSNNEFTGIHTALFEVDHFATSFSEADASMTAAFNFGGTDNGLTLRLNANGAAQDVDNLTVFQAQAVPEPSALALLGMGLLALAYRHKARA